jgi:hypothetical protein
VECDEEVDVLGMVGYNSVKGWFVNILDSGDDVGEMRRGFLMRNGEKISREVVLGVLRV